MSLSFLQAMLGIVAILLSAGACRVRSENPSNAVRESSVVDAINRFYVAAEARDWNGVESLLADDFEFYSDDVLILDKSTFLAAMQSDDMLIQQLELSELKVHVSDDGQMAWGKYQVDLESLIRGEPYNVVTAETVVFRRRGTDWQMTHNHASIRNLATSPSN